MKRSIAGRMTNEINRCTCNGDFGSYELIDRINFTQPTWVRRCKKCDGLLEGDYI